MVLILPLGKGQFSYDSVTETNNANKILANGIPYDVHRRCLLSKFCHFLSRRTLLVVLVKKDTLQWCMYICTTQRL